MKIPNPTPSFEQVSKQMRINVDVLKEEITNHINAELERFNTELEKAKNTHVNPIFLKRLTKEL